MSLILKMHLICDPIEHPYHIAQRNIEPHKVLSIGNALQGVQSEDTISHSG